MGRSGAHHPLPRDSVLQSWARARGRGAFRARGSGRRPLRQGQACGRVMPRGASETGRKGEGVSPAWERGRDTHKDQTPSVRLEHTSPLTPPVSGPDALSFDPYTCSSSQYRETQSPVSGPGTPGEPGNRAGGPCKPFDQEHRPPFRPPPPLRPCTGASRLDPRRLHRRAGATRGVGGSGKPFPPRPPMRGRGSCRSKRPPPNCGA